jgi:hypothetical protein
MRAPEKAKSLIRVEDERGDALTLPSGSTYPAGCRIMVDTGQCRAAIATAGYVSGVAAGSFVDAKTGAHDLGFGLSIVDFLLEPADAQSAIAAGQYSFGPTDRVHGNIPKRYVEGPQICTQARRLAPRVYRGDGFAAIQTRYHWNVAYAPHPRAGSVWEQTLIFPEGERFFLSSDRVTTVAESPALFLRVDMPGHIKHRGGMGFDHAYLSYHDPSIIPSTEFVADFAPDERFLYRRDQRPLPERFIRAYQVTLPGGAAGPWLAGMTLTPRDVYQAWCHQRGYVCLIEELGGDPTRSGDTFGACYLIGWFDDLDSMHRTHDRFRGWSGLALEGTPGPPTGYKGISRGNLTAVPIDQGE